MSPPCRTRSKPRGSTAGCSTISRARTPSRRAWRASAGTAGIWPPAGGSTSCRRRAQPGGSCTPSSGTTWTTCPAPSRRTRDASQLEAGLKSLLAGLTPGGDGILARQRHPVRVARRCRHRRDGARGRRGRRHQRAISSSASTGSGTPPRSRRTARPPTSSIASRTARSRPSPGGSRDGVADHRVRHPAADGGSGSRTKGWSRDPRRTSRRRRTPGNPHYLPTADQHRAIRPRRTAAAGSLGQAATRPAPSMPTSRGSPSPAATFRTADARVCRHRASARRRGALVQDAAARGAAVRGFELDRAARQVIDEARLRRAILHRTGHSLGEEVHGNGAHLDDYETHDERRLMPRQRLHHRAGRLLRRFRRSDGNQRGLGPGRTRGDRPAPDRYHPVSVRGRN